jgi:hypothetical protein
MSEIKGVGKRVMVTYGVGRLYLARLSYKPVPGVLKSGMPQLTDIPAPVMKTIFAVGRSFMNLTMPSISNDDNTHGRSGNFVSVPIIVLLLAVGGVRTLDGPSMLVSLPPLLLSTGIVVVDGTVDGAAAISTRRFCRIDGC